MFIHICNILLNKNINFVMIGVYLEIMIYLNGKYCTCAYVWLISEYFWNWQSDNAGF